MKLYRLTFTILLSVMSPLALRADRIQIVNQNNKALAVKIQAEEDCTDGDLPRYTVIIPAKYFYEIIVTKFDLGGAERFTIEGGTDPTKNSGKCSNLDVHKKYKFIFKDDPLGTSCLATEITG